MKKIHSVYPLQSSIIVDQSEPPFRFPVSSAPHRLAHGPASSPLPLSCTGDQLAALATEASWSREAASVTLHIEEKET